MLAFTPGTVRHMSVRSPDRAGESADRHGRPCKPCYQHGHLMTWPGDTLASTGIKAGTIPPQFRADAYAERFVLIAQPR
jgi:hypothetical protein